MKDAKYRPFLIVIEKIPENIEISFLVNIADIIFGQYRDIIFGQYSYSARSAHCHVSVHHLLAVSIVTYREANVLPYTGP